MSKMSALNMAMNGNAYKMIEIKKVSGPVVPLRKHFESYFSLPASLSPALSRNVESNQICIHLPPSNLVPVS